MRHTHTSKVTLKRFVFLPLQTGRTTKEPPFLGWGAPIFMLLYSQIFHTRSATDWPLLYKLRNVMHITEQQ